MTWLATLALAACPTSPSPRAEALTRLLQASQQAHLPWRDGWSGAFGLAGATMLSTAGLLAPAERPGWYAGAAWTLAGIPFVLLQAEPPPPPCEDAEALERRVLALVATEARSATLASQGLSLALNAGAGLAMGALLDDWVGALVNFLVNSAISALVLATTPRGTRARWERYQLQFAP